MREMMGRAAGRRCMAVTLAEYTIRERALYSGLTRGEVDGGRIWVDLSAPQEDCYRLARRCDGGRGKDDWPAPTEGIGFGDRSLGCDVFLQETGGAGKVETITRRLARTPKSRTLL